MWKKLIRLRKVAEKIGDSGALEDIRNMAQAILSQTKNSQRFTQLEGAKSTIEECELLVKNITKEYNKEIDDASEMLNNFDVKYGIMQAPRHSVYFGLKDEKGFYYFEFNLATTEFHSILSVFGGFPTSSSYTQDGFKNIVIANRYSYIPEFRYILCDESNIGLACSEMTEYELQLYNNYSCNIEVGDSCYIHGISVSGIFVMSDNSRVELALSRGVDLTVGDNSSVQSHGGEVDIITGDNCKLDITYGGTLKCGNDCFIQYNGENPNNFTNIDCGKDTRAFTNDGKEIDISEYIRDEPELEDVLEIEPKVDILSKYMATCEKITVDTSITSTLLRKVADKGILEMSELLKSENIEIVEKDRRVYMCGENDESDMRWCLFFLKSSGQLIDLVTYWNDAFNDVLDYDEGDKIIDKLSSILLDKLL